MQNVSAWEDNEMVQEAPERPLSALTTAGAHFLPKALLGEKHFGGLWNTCVSLFSLRPGHARATGRCFLSSPSFFFFRSGAVTGGNDWMMYGELLRHLSSDFAR